MGDISNDFRDNIVFRTHMCDVGSDHVAKHANIDEIDRVIRMIRYVSYATKGVQDMQWM